MPKELRLTKVSIQESAKSLEYSTPDAAIESIQTISTKYGLPILDLLRMIVTRSVDSISLGKDDPYVYVYARKHRDSISFRINEGSRSIRFDLPLEDDRLGSLRLRIP